MADGAGQRRRVAGKPFDDERERGEKGFHAPPLADRAIRG
jgi:hypothetical protein